jgi:Replication protein A C terminal
MNANTHDSRYYTGSAIRDSILEFIRDESKRVEIGASIVSILERFAGRYTEEEIRRAVFDLRAQGHVYETVDDDHVKYAM